jgi:hypothetical protein
MRQYIIWSPSNVEGIDYNKTGNIYETPTLQTKKKYMANH